MLKRIVSRLPHEWQHELRRWRILRATRRGSFKGDEPELRTLPDLVKESDTVFDIGANVGIYTLRLSELVGPTGRVIAFEPIPETFAILASNVLAARCRNVTLINAAASNRLAEVSMGMPMWDSGLPNYYQAAITEWGDHAALSLPLDVFEFSAVNLIKVDVEGHEHPVLEGARRMIERCRPVVILEGTEECEAANWLRELGYDIAHAPCSPNVVARPRQLRQKVPRMTHL